LKELATYCLANDDNYDFYLLRHFEALRQEFCEGVKRGDTTMKDGRIIWKAWGELEHRAKRDFKQKMVSAGTDEKIDVEAVSTASVSAAD